MTTCKRVIALGGAMLLGVSGVAQASGSVDAELSALRARVAQLEGSQNQSWLNERRAEEVKTLVREVLADADTRASMQEGGVAAGYNNGFFLASEDGKFLLNISGQLQTRYTFNHREGSLNNNGGTSDNWSHGFSLPRTKLFFEGHVGSPKIGYKVILHARDTEFSDNGIFVEEAVVSGQVADNVTVYGGRVAYAYDRLGRLDTRYLTALERFSAGSFDYGNWTGAGVIVNINDAARVNAMLYNQYDNGVDFGVEYGVAARGEFKLAGNWDQYNDMNAWSNEGTLSVIGVGVRYEQGREGTASNIDESRAFSLTADYSLETNGLSILAAGYFNTNFDNSNYYHTYALVGQVGYFFVADKVEGYARAEYANAKDGDSEMFAATAGVNYYLAKHAAKFTFELNYSKYAVFGYTDSGFLPQDAGDRNQIFAAAQFQLLF